MKVAEFIRPESVVVDLAAKSKSRVLQIMSAKASEALGIEERPVLQALVDREKLGSTGIGEGIAIPHTRVAGVVHPFGMLARLSKAIDFEAVDDIPVDIVFLLLIPGESRKDHLNALACVARQLRSHEVLKKIRSATSADELYAAVVLQADSPE
ncbi:PTS sugar transporter subunit IIA [Mesorhizobium helmanticense]|uniref:Transcriptional regulator n=1 Tax=Mesorhizobium helmanticense TaxID=1776423 RepID=A0A2T4IRR5_9HYPH|nr:PTS sugar transporter subunit IIA [Mesorhizobium helmanticense]PTE08258.1 transcriptional regulator [Mesorhizobium helmanticense]